MGKRETAGKASLCLAGEKLSELIKVVDGPRAVLAKLEGLVIETLLDLTKDFGNAGDKLLPGDSALILRT